MKSGFYLFAFLVFLLFTLPVKAAFVEGLEDIPLAEGLTLAENGSLSFGNEEIRLIERLFISQTKTFQDVKKFYIETLPQMGWQKKENSENKISFEREGEVLEFNIESDKPLIVRLTVKSKN